MNQIQIFNKQFYLEKCLEPKDDRSISVSFGVEPRRLGNVRQSHASVKYVVLTRTDSTLVCPVYFLDALLTNIFTFMPKQRNTI